MTLGQAAYKQWNELLRPTFLPVLWENLSEQERRSWEHVANAVIEEDAKQASEIAHANGTQDCHSCD